MEPLLDGTACQKVATAWVPAQPQPSIATGNGALPTGWSPAVTATPLADYLILLGYWRKF